MADNRPPPRIEIVTHWPNDGGESSDMVPEGHTVVVLSVEQLQAMDCRYHGHPIPDRLQSAWARLVNDCHEALGRRLANGGTDE